MFLRVTQVHINILWLKNNLFCKKFFGNSTRKCHAHKNEIYTFVSVLSNIVISEVYEIENEIFSHCVFYLHVPYYGSSYSRLKNV